METDKTVQLGEGHFKLLNEFQKYEGIFFCKIYSRKIQLGKDHFFTNNFRGLENTEFKVLNSKLTFDLRLS